jgi:GNAT superfamily N-acetyltransferase
MTDIFDAIEATWPAAATHRIGPWRLREGRGGGSRVGSASAEGPVTAADLAPLVRAAAGIGQTPLVMVRDGEAALDSLLAAAGWVVTDEVVIYAAPVGAFSPPPPLAAFAHWPPLAAAADIWEEGHIGPARRAVMGRCTVPKTAILARSADRAAGAAFAACLGNTAVTSAVTVRESLRRQGTGGHLMRAAADWAAGQGAARLALAVTRGNAPARALYASLGMEVVGHYHYRQGPKH